MGSWALRMGYSSPKAGYTLSRQLGIVGNYCLMNSLPALNAIVVNALSDEPGKDVVLSPAKDSIRSLSRCTSKIGMRWASPPPAPLGRCGRQCDEGSGTLPQASGCVGARYRRTLVSCGGLAAPAPYHWLHGDPPAADRPRSSAPQFCLWPGAPRLS
jgi:hypothetical protein